MKNNNTPIIIAIIVLFILLGIALFYTQKSEVKVQPPQTIATVTNFEECANAGYPIMESYPAQCRDAQGNLFVQIVAQPPVTPNPNPTPIPNDDIQN